MIAAHTCDEGMGACIEIEIGFVSHRLGHLDIDRSGVGGVGLSERQCVLNIFWPDTKNDRLADVAGFAAWSRDN